MMSVFKQNGDVFHGICRKTSENHTNLPSHLFTLYSHIKHPDLKWYEMVYCNDANGRTSNSFTSFLNCPGSIHGSSYTQAQW